MTEYWLGFAHGAAALIAIVVAVRVLWEIADQPD